MRSVFKHSIGIRVLLFVSATFLSGAATGEETLKIGLLVSLSGPSMVTGRIQSNIAKHFQKVNGDIVSGKRIEVLVRDTTGPNPEVVRRVTQEMIFRDKVQIMVGIDFTPNALAIAPLVTEAKVPTFLTGSAASGVVEKSPFYLRTFFTIPQVVRPLVQWAHKNGIRKPYILVADYAPGHEAEEQFSKTFLDLGVKTAGVQRIPLRTPEFSSYMQRIKDADPDSVFVFVPIGEMAPQFLQAYAQSGLKNGRIRLFGTGDLTDESIVEAAGDAAVGVITSGVYSNSHDSTLNQTLLFGFSEQFGKSPRLNLSAVAAWDAFQLIYDGLAAQGSSSFDPVKFTQFVKGRSIESARGSILIDRTSGDITQNVYIRRVDKVAGVLQNIEIDTVRSVSSK